MLFRATSSSSLKQHWKTRLYNIDGIFFSAKYEIHFYIQLTRISVFLERSTSQAVSWLPVMVEARFQSRASHLWWIIRQRDRGFFLSTSVFFCQYHSTKAPYPSSFTRCSYQKEKRAKTGKHRTEQYFRFFNHYRGKYGRLLCQGQFLFLLFLT